MTRSNASLFSLAPFTMAALAINVALYFVAAFRSQNLMDMNSSVLVAMGASLRERLWEGEWVRLIAPMFLHGGLIHIFFNMNFLWRAGPDAEVYFGTPNFGTIYLVSGVTGICFSMIFGGHLSIGASGSLCGIMGAHLAVSVLNCPVLSKAWRNSAVRADAFNLLFLIGIGVLGFLNMDNWAHFGGMLSGFVLGTSFELWRRRKGIGRIGVFATLAATALLICAARWTVFNPTYHLYQYAYAMDIDKDPGAAKYHAAEARKWAGIWSSLHFLGVLNLQETDAILLAHDLRYWTIHTARTYVRDREGISGVIKYRKNTKRPDLIETDEKK